MGWKVIVLTPRHLLADKVGVSGGVQCTMSSQSPATDAEELHGPNAHKVRSPYKSFRPPGIARQEPLVRPHESATPQVRPAGADLWGTGDCRRPAQRSSPNPGTRALFRSRRMGARMTIEDAKKITPLLDAIIATAAVIPVLRGKAAFDDSTRMLLRHVNQLRKIVDHQGSVE